MQGKTKLRVKRSPIALVYQILIQIQMQIHYILLHITYRQFIMLRKTFKDSIKPLTCHTIIINHQIMRIIGIITALHQSSKILIFALRLAITRIFQCKPVGRSIFGHRFLAVYIVIGGTATGATVGVLTCFENVFFPELNIYLIIFVEVSQ